MKHGFIYKLLFALLFVSGIHSQLIAQIQVKGKITDDQSTPLPGVNVLVKGTQTGTVTNLEGDYSIVLPAGYSELTISYIGYLTETFVINEANGNVQTLAISMIPDLTELEDVVVIGYGTVKKGDLTGAVSVISSEELTNSHIPTVSKAIQGKAAGVVVLQDGAPGGKVNLRVRGIGSINNNPNPIYVVDGIKGVDINTIAPEDIATISVLKDASSSAIYGSDAANGVVLITTKRGSNMAKPKIDFSASFSTSQFDDKFNLMDADEYSSFYNDVYKELGVASHAAYTDNFRQQYFDGDWNKGTDWQDKVLQSNLTQNYYLNISHGNEISNYSLSFSYLDEEGMLINTGSNRFNIRANSDYKLGKYIKVGETLNITRRTTQKSNSDAWSMTLESTPLMNIYNADNKEGYEGCQIPFEYIDTTGLTATALNTGGNDKFNPVGMVSIPQKYEYFDNVLVDVYLSIEPFKGFVFRSSLSASAYENQTHEWTPAYDMGVRSQGTASLLDKRSNGVTYILKNQLSYNLTSGKHFIDATAVQEISKSGGSNLDGSGSGFPYEQVPVMSQAQVTEATGGEWEGSMMSYIGRVTYNFDSKYLFTASFRHDGSPNFLPENQWATFPAFSAGWKINEDFLQNVSQLDMLKLRVGWGKTGFSQIGNFKYKTNIGSPTYFRPVFGLESTQAYALNEDVWGTPGNPKIKWEASEMSNIGIDVNAFSNKIQFSVEYFRKKTEDLLNKTPISLIHGKGINWNPGQPWYNAGTLENSGFEFDIRYNKMEGNFTYKVFANLSSVKNEVTDLPASFIKGDNITMEGEAIGSLYGYKALRIVQESDFDEDGNFLYASPVQGQPSPGDIMFEDVKIDSTINDNDITVIGKPIPDFTYSFGFDLFYRDFDLSIFFYGMHGVEVLNSSRRRVETFRTQDMDHNKSADWAANYYGKDGKPSTEYVRADKNDENLNSRTSSWWVDDASFLRLKDVQIGYTLPKELLKPIGISSTRIYVSGMNLFTFTKYEGYDPESPLNNDDPKVPGVDDNKYPIPRIFSAGISVSF